MTALRDAMIQDRNLRDTARALVDADIRNLRADLSTKGLAERAMDRVSTSASAVYDEAIEVAADHKGALAAIAAALVLWFARHPLLAAVTGEDDGEIGA